MKIKLKCFPVIIIALAMLYSCGGNQDLASTGKSSSTTGWEYNDPANGGFEVKNAVEQETGPGLVLIEGGTFTMGRVQ
ncbi:MAG: gliding motility lipoprotein GldJ, partial [Bacteroidota bacterium]